EALEVALGMVKQPLLILDPELKIRSVNQAFLSAFQLQQPEIKGQSLFQLADAQFDIPNLRLLLEDILPKNKRVSDYHLEAEFPKIGRRQLKLNASRFFEEGRGMQLILLALEDYTEPAKTEPGNLKI